MNKDELIEAYAQNIVEGMGMDELYTFALETMMERLETYTEEDLEEEVREFAPHLLGE